MTLENLHWETLAHSSYMYVCINGWAIRNNYLCRLNLASYDCHNCTMSCSLYTIGIGAIKLALGDQLNDSVQINALHEPLKSVLITEISENEGH